MAIRPWIIVGGIVAVAAIITTIVLVVILRRSSNNCALFQEPIGVSILERTDDILLSWTHPWPNKECGVSYTIEYTVDDSNRQEVNTAGTSVTVPRPNLCSSLTFTLWAVNKAGERSNDPITRTYKVRPMTGGVSNIEMSSTEAGLNITWSRPTGLDNCNLYYILVFLSDIPDLDREEMETSHEYIVFPGNKYCFQVTVYIYTYVFEQHIPGSSRMETFIDRVSGIKIQQSHEKINEMIVTWANHPRQHECSLTYEVEYSIDGKTDEAVVQTQDFAVTFPANLCSHFVIVVSAYSAITFTWNMPVVVEKILAPTILGPVQNGRIDFTGGNIATISWKPPELASHCTNLNYLVNARNEQTGQETSCTGQTKCSLSIHNFCSRTVFSIREISGITQEVSFYHYCN